MQYKPFLHSTNYCISCPSLRALCNGFDITLAHFFVEGEMVELALEQKAFFTQWITFSAEQKEMLMNLISSMKWFFVIITTRQTGGLHKGFFMQSLSFPFEILSLKMSLSLD